MDHKKIVIKFIEHLLYTSVLNTLFIQHSHEKIAIIVPTLKERKLIGTDLNSFPINCIASKKLVWI